MIITECERRVLAIIFDLQGNADFPGILNGVNRKYQTDWSEKAVKVFIKRLLKKKYIRKEKKGGTVFYRSAFARSGIDKEVLWDIRNTSFERDWEKVIAYIREQQENIVSKIENPFS